jgi:hypothetical protein
LVCSESRKKSRPQNSVNDDGEHDPEKWVPVFRKDHAQSKR